METQTQMQTDQNKTTTSESSVVSSTLNAKDIRYVTFDAGLYGFSDAKKFALKKFSNDRYRDFMHLINLDQQGLSFVLYPLNASKDTLIESQDLQKLTLDLGLDVENTEAYAVTSLSKDPNGNINFSLNLQAPLIIEADQNSGWQKIIEGKSYTVSHAI